MTWPTAKLGDCAQIVSGSTPRRNVREYWGGDILWVTPKDLSNLEGKYISTTPDKLTQEGYDSCSTTLLPADSVLLSSRAPIGLVAINAVPMATNQGFKSLVPDLELLDSTYLYYWLKANTELLQNMGRGATFKEISKRIVEEIEIPLPPLEEQRRIAAILDTADTLRTKRRQAIAKLDTLLQSTFLTMFGDPVTNPMGWEVRPLGEVATRFQNGIGKNKEYYGQGQMVANIGDLYEWHTFQPRAYSLLEVSDSEIEKYRLDAGDLLFVRSSVKREGVAYCSMYRSDETCLFSSFMIRAQLDQAVVNPEFLAFLLRTQPMRKRLINASNTATITNISQDGLSGIDLILPPVNIQAAFIKAVRRVEGSLQQSQKQQKCFDELFGSLQQRAFRGDL